jgi:phage pi2 protein 07
MRCKCGHVIQPASSPPETFAVIRNSDYQKFIKSETRVLAAKDMDAKLRAIARSARLIGTMVECPKCSRTLFMKPGGDEVVFLRRDE